MPGSVDINLTASGRNFKFSNSADEFYRLVKIQNNNYFNVPFKSSGVVDDVDYFGPSLIFHHIPVHRTDREAK